MNGSLDFERPLIELEKRIEELRQFTKERGIDLTDEIKTLETKADSLKKEIYENLSSWQRVMLARHPRRPFAMDYIERIFQDFVELHGDRRYRDDKAIIGGIGLLDGVPVTVIAEQKGRDTKENILRNFGMPFPDGYRKALRLMTQAEKFGRPIITFIDTSGAFPGLEAEERGQAEAIAYNLLFMSRLRVPVICVVIGEGGSGGALAIGVGNRVLMLENSVYSVISPEGCAAILWHEATPEAKAKASEALKMTAQDLLSLGVIDEVIDEPLGGAHRDHDDAARRIRKALLKHLKQLGQLDQQALIENRYQKFRHMVRFIQREGPPT